MGKGRWFPGKRCLGAAVILCLFGASVGSVTVGAASEATLSGANTMSLSVSDMDLSTLTVSESLSVTYRYDQLSVSSRTSLGNEGLLAQSFRMACPLGDLSLQGSGSFTSEQFSRADLSVSGRSGQVAYGVTLLIAELGTQTDSAVGVGVTIRVAGVIEQFARVSAILGLGATPYGQIEEGCDLCYDGIRLSLTDVDLCAGKATLDVLFGQTGFESETVSWNGPLPLGLLEDFTLRVSARFSDLFSYEGSTLSLGGMVGVHAVNASFAYDTGSTSGDLTDFLQGSLSVRSPFFEGQLVSTASFDPDTLLALSFNWTRAFEAWSANLTPTFEILDQSGGVLAFDIPSWQVTLRFDLACCVGQPAAELGDVVLSLTVSRDGFDRVVVSHSFPF
jgi:hypothetical protein